MRNFSIALVLAATMAITTGCDTTSTTEDSSEGMAASSAPAVDAAGFPTGTQADLAVTAGDRVYFAFDKSDLTPEAMATTQAQASWLAQYPVNITIAGHCDARGTQEYNLGLGMRRAIAHRDGLVTNGVAPDRIATISYGKEMPIVEGTTEEAYALNRATVVSIN